MLDAVSAAAPALLPSTVAGVPAGGCALLTSTADAVYFVVSAAVSAGVCMGMSALLTLTVTDAAGAARRCSRQQEAQ